MDSLKSPSDLDDLKRPDLQKLAKKYGVKANMKSDKLRNALSEILFKDGNQSQNFDRQNSSASESANSMDEGEVADSTGIKASKSESFGTPKCKTPAKSMTPRSVRALAKGGTPRTFSPALAKNNSGTFPNSGVKKNLGRKVGTPQRYAIIPEPKKPESAQKRKLSESRSTSDLSTENLESKTKRQRRSTFDKEPSEIIGEPAGRSRRSTFDKSPSEIPTEMDTRKSSRRSTFDKSPGVSEMLHGINDDMTDQEMKEKLMNALDKRVQEKHQLKPIKTAPSTSIPRFTGISTVSAKKPATPGQKDWEKIHAKTFSKMKSLDEVLKEKEARSNKISASLKKIKQMRDTMRSKVESLKRYETPPSVKKSAAKVSKITKALPFGSPANKAFVPTVTSTSKANFNFSTVTSVTKKQNVKSSSTPSVAQNKPFVPTVTSTSKASFNFGKTSSITSQRKSPRLSSAQNGSKENARKSVGLNKTVEGRKSIGLSKTTEARRSGVTPFKFTGNTSLNISATAKPKFDLQASLAKKPTWKPHTGKLKPVGSSYSSMGSVKNVTVKTKEERRKMQMKQRTDSRLDANLKRRGLVA